MQKIINRLIDESVVNADKYVNNGSTWLIFTETKQWVIELTKDGTLWYNYNFFKNLLAYMSMDVVENQQYITKWVEDTIINGGKKVKMSPFVVYQANEHVENTIQGGVKETLIASFHMESAVENTIQDGVKDTRVGGAFEDVLVENTIENGVKQLRHRKGADDTRAENIIQNGVKQTRLFRKMKSSVVEDTIQNGVKQTYSGGDVCRNDSIEDTIDKGVKETICLTMDYKEFVEETIQNGVKETKSERATREWKSEQVIENGVKETKLGAPDNRDYFIEDTIQNGVKETNKSLRVDGSCVIEDTIQNGVKKTHRFGLGNEAEIEDAIVNGVKDTKFSIFMNSTCVKDTIQNGVKHTISVPTKRSYDVGNTIKNGIRHVEIGCAQYNNVEDVIKGGVKKTKAMEEWVNAESIVDKTMRDGVKSTKPGGYLGSIEMKGKMVHQLESPKQNNEVEDVIQHGIKKTEAAALFDEESTINTVISEGIKETHDDVYHHTSRVEGVIRNGIKEVQPLPAQDGNMDWGNYYHRQEDRTKPHTQYVNDVILNGNKDTLKKSTY